MGIIRLVVVLNTILISAEIAAARCMAAHYLERPEHLNRNPHAPILNAEERRFVVHSNVG